MAFKLWAGQEIVAGPPPTAVATASPSTVVVGQVVTFDGSGSKDKDTKITWEEKDGEKYNFQRTLINGAIETWSWDFGDGGSGSGETTTHKYTQPGEYTVTLSITADHGETATATTSVTVYPPCPVCKDLKAKKAKLEKQLLEKQEALKKIEDELKKLDRTKKAIEKRLSNINKELKSIAGGGMSVAESLVTEENKWKFLLELLKVPFRMDKDAKRAAELWSEYLLLDKKKEEIEDRIKELEPQRDRLEGEIEKIEKRIEEIDKDIASCQYPPEH